MSDRFVRRRRPPQSPAGSQPPEKKPREKKIALPALSDLLANKRVVQIVSLVIAVIIWAAVSTGAAVQETKTIKNIPIEFDANGTLYSSLGLKLISSSIDTVDVRVTGPRYVLSQLSSNDIKAYAAVSTVDGPGEYTLALSAAPIDNSRSVTAAIVSAANVTAVFDTYDTVTLPIEGVPAGEIMVAEGYVIGEPVTDPAQVSVSCPSSQAETIKRAVVRYSTGETPVSSTFTQVSRIILLDLNGDEVPVSANTSLLPTGASVSVPVYKCRKVGVSLNIENAPEGYADEFLRMEPSEIVIAGEPHIVNSIEKLIVGHLDVSTVLKSAEITCNFELNSGLIDVENVRKIDVKVDYSKIRKKTASVSSFRLGGISGDTKYSVTIATTSIDGVQMYGSKKGIADMSESKLFAVIDLTDATLSPGRRKVPVSVRSSGDDMVWAVGKYSAEIVVTEK